MKSKVFACHEYIRKALLLLFLCFLCVGIAPQVIMAASETDPVKTIHELNQALGGNHKVQGNTITLRSDVVVTDTIVISGYNMDKIVIEMNGHTIKGVTDKDMFWIDSPRGKNTKNLKIYLEGKGKIQAKNCIFNIMDDSLHFVDKQEIHKGVCLYFDGNITYKVTGEDGCVVVGGWKITINDGTFEGTHPIWVGMSDAEDAHAIKRDRSSVVINGGTIKGDCYFEKTKWKMTGGTITGDVRTDCIKNYVKDCTINGRLILGSVWAGYENSLQVKENAEINKGLQVDSAYARIHVMGGTITGEDVAIDVIGYGSCSDIEELYRKETASYIKISDGVVQATSENGIGIRTRDFTGDTDQSDQAQKKVFMRVILAGGEVIANTPLVNLMEN